GNARAADRHRWGPVRAPASPSSPAAQLLRAAVAARPAVPATPARGPHCRRIEPLEAARAGQEAVRAEREAPLASPVRRAQQARGRGRVSSRRKRWTLALPPAPRPAAAPLSAA